jgi:hypothetical protein
MFFRFGAAIALLVMIALVGIAIEKRNLQAKRALTHEVYLHDQLMDQSAKLRLRTQQLRAPARLQEAAIDPPATRPKTQRK